MKLYMLLTKAAHQKENFQTCTARIKIHQIAHVFKLCVTLQWEIGLLYFFSWNFTWFLQMESTKVQNVRLSTAQVKFHRIRTLIGLFYWMYIKSQLNVWKSCFMTPKSGAKFEEKLIFCFKNDKYLVTKILIQALKSLKNLHFDWFLLCKVYNVWPKTSTEELYFMTLKSHATFEEKLTCGLVMTWGIWQIFIRTLERVKTGTFMGSFCLK